MNAIIAPAAPGATALPQPPADAGALRLSEVLGALSYALDLTEGQPPGHCLRCGWIGMQIGFQLGLGSLALSDLYYTLLLKDAGCSSNAARLWQLYGGDERVTKHDYKTVDSQSVAQLGLFVLRHAGAGEALRARVARVLDLARNGEQLATELIATRCERGADIVRRFGFSERVAAGVFSLDEHWNGKGRPQGLRGQRIPLGARIALLAQVVDVFNTVGGPIAALAEARRRSGTWFDPRVVEAFAVAARADTFWGALADPALDARVAALEPTAHVIPADEDRLDVVAAAFADIIDAKSSYTAGHSRRVTAYADAMADRLGMTGARRRWLRRAGMLHDIGKLGVGSGILDKPGKLDSGEWEAMRRHAVLSEEILGRISIFRDLAPVAAAHHERLDGRGYPKRLGGGAIARETRILTAADIFDALTADRPYRAAFPVADALAIMRKDVGTALDPDIFAALEAAAPGFGLAA